MYTDVLHAALIDKASHAYVVHLNEDAFLEATGLFGYKVQQVASQEPNMTNIGRAMDSRDMEHEQSLSRLQNFLDFVLGFSGCKHHLVYCEVVFLHVLYESNVSLRHTSLILFL